MLHFGKKYYASATIYFNFCVMAAYLIKFHKMAKTLRVIESFFVMEVGDTFILSDDGKYYVSCRNEEFRNNSEDGSVDSSYTSEYRISTEYAKDLIENGYLEEVGSTKREFVNVFDEIDNLIDRYQIELNNLDKDLANEPQCVKVEKTTVLTNLLSVLTHLKTLRK